MYRRWLLLLNHFLVVACVSLNHRFDSTVYHHIEQFKSRMLKQLGLTRVPSLTHVNTTAEEMQRMLDVYHQKLKEDELEEQRLRHASLLEYASLTPKVMRSDEQNQRTFFFALPNIPAETKMLHSATLRLSNYHNSTGLLRVFQLTSSGQNLVSETHVSVSNDWEVTDLSRVARDWIKDPSSNRGVKVECIRCEELFSNRATLELLVSNRGHRIKRSTERKNARTQQYNTDCVKGRRTGCCRKSLKISFRDIGWNWIIQPATFDPYICHGRCMEGNLLIGTHAVIKKILWEKMGGKRSMRLCCVPEKKMHLRVLHLNNQNPPQFETTKLRNIIVKHCGCA